MESAAVLGLETALLVSLTAIMLSGLAVLNDGERASADLLRHRQVERLLAGSFERCATGPGVVVEALSDKVVLACDSDGDGEVDLHSSELTTLAVRGSGSQRRLAQQFGGQSRTLVKGLPVGSAFSYYDRSGGISSSASNSRAVAVPTAAGLLLFALPETAESSGG